MAASPSASGDSPAAPATTKRARPLDGGEGEFGFGKRRRLERDGLLRSGRGTGGDGAVVVVGSDGTRGPDVGRRRRRRPGLQNLLLSLKGPHLQVRAQRALSPTFLSDVPPSPHQEVYAIVYAIGLHDIRYRQMMSF
jgi:hypothetical protein